MKRLFRSSKFWATIIGSGVGYLFQLHFEDSTLTLAIIGAFTAITIATGVEDTVEKYTITKNG